MDAAEALIVIRSLADGRDPSNGAPLPAESVFHRPEVIRALFAAAEALRGDAGKPPAAGGAWSPDEEARLVASFGKNVSQADIAKAHGRTPGAIRSRLKKLGLIEDGGEASAAPQTPPRAPVAVNRKPDDDIPF